MGEINGLVYTQAQQLQEQVLPSVPVGSETSNVFMTMVGSGDGMCLECVAAVGLHITEHKVVLLQHKSK